MHIVDGEPRAASRTTDLDSDPRKTVKLLEWSVNADATESVWPHFGAAWGNVFLPGHSREPVFVREGDSLLVEVYFAKQPLAKIIYSVKRRD